MRTIPPLLVAALACACTDPPALPAPTVAAAPDPPAPSAPAVAAEVQELAPGYTIAKNLPDGRPLMTPWDFALLVIDPADLDPKERRRRGYARRKLIMNNPDSAAARALNDLQAAHQAGELDIPGKDSGVVFTLPGTKPTSGRPPAGHRPEPESAPEPVGGG